MKKFDGYLILTDIDGTLTNSRGEISPENAAAIRHFQSEGGRITVASGRFPTYISKYADSFVPNTYIVGANGTMLYDPIKKETVMERPLDNSVTGVLHEIAALCPEIHTLYVASPKCDLPVKREDFDRMDEILAAHEKPWFKVIFVQKAADSRAVRDRLISAFGDRYTFDLSWNEGLELHALGTGKGAMLGELVRILGSEGHPVKKTICVGDYENDVSMIRAADIGYAVENAAEEVKAAADRITVHYEKHAIAAIIADLEAELDAQNL